MSRDDADGLRRKTGNFATVCFILFLASQVIPYAEYFWGTVIVVGLAIGSWRIAWMFTSNEMNHAVNRDLTTEELEQVAQVRQMVIDGTWKNELERATSAYRANKQAIMLDVLQEPQTPDDKNDD